METAVAQRHRLCPEPCDRLRDSHGILGAAGVWRRWSRAQDHLPSNNDFIVGTPVRRSEPPTQFENWVSSFSFFLGSASLELISRATESLAGRIAYVEMRTLSALEVVPTHAQLETLWLRGGFPDSLTAEGDNASLAWRTDFVRSYLERDVPMFAPRMPATTIGRLWTMLAHSQGTLLNSARLAQALGVSAPMVGRYLDLLEDLLLVRRLAPWHGNIAKRLVKSPKVYLRDSGLVHALLEIETLHQLLGHPVVGMSWEGFVIENLLAAAGPGSIPLHFRTADGAEIDLLLERAGQPAFAIEIKRSSAPVPSPGFYRAAQAIGAQHKVLVAPVGDSYRTKDDVVVMDVLAAVKLLSR